MSDPTSAKDETTALSQAVTVSVQTRFLAEQSQPRANRFVYSYEITISNNSLVPVQLLHRHWLITEEADAPHPPTTQKVDGPGVIGQQPVIQPQQHYRYASGAVITTPIGTMTGHYDMQTLEGLSFKVSIPTFALIQAHKLH
ncbi:Co2+/Mg2+ efflux protein ApaG [Marinagarivorans algicola]|uniref:Co2+/Mg2+ efflux protein ApaG n=1 Tax=Marinagarivorans algicola TaxID=1513270 RepID=UPI0006B5DD18|nr:Co2+/Mg2+ efflux protein ApaG [Marinagarivorans algicola]